MSDSVFAAQWAITAAIGKRIFAWIAESPASRVLDPLPFVLDLEKKHFEEIGFIPAPRLADYRDKGQLWVTNENEEPCGFLVWGNGWPVLRVYQVCIQYDAQRRLHGAALIGRLINKAESEGYDRISCWVADDIPANDFWQSMGFKKSGQRQGGSKRGRMHNAWVYWCTQPAQSRLSQLECAV